MASPSPPTPLEAALDVEEADPAIDFLNLSVRLNRPSDHYRGINPYEPPPRRRPGFAPHHLAQRFIQDPVTTTLSSFSKVANWAFSGHEEAFRHPIETQRMPDIQQVIDMITSKSDGHSGSQEESGRSSRRESEPYRAPPPALPGITCSVPQFRLEPLTAKEFDDMIDRPAEEILNRIFRGGIADNDLRQRLWPLVLGLTKDWKEVEWETRDYLYDHYSQQWMNILPDQEDRFTAYRERKSICERDVIRCDRSHSFFSDNQENLDKLKAILMAYVMHDFDTGYVQGMTDLASPLLYVWDGDVKRSFWCFVQVMQLFKNNFELSQKTISYQLQLLFKLIKLTDPCFAQYLSSKESDNCYFAFRWIICLFKREFMKAKTDDYHDCLIVWETIWASTALTSLKAEREKERQNSRKTEAKSSPSKQKDKKRQESTVENSSNENGQEALPVKDKTEESPARSSSTGSSTSTSSVSQERVSDSPKSSTTGSMEPLSDVQLFVLCICLSIIRRERDLIMARQYDACETLKHFNTLHLNDSLNNILLHASNIWFWLKNDGGQEQLYAPEVNVADKRHDSGGEDFDLLNDEFTLITTMNT